MAGLVPRGSAGINHVGAGNRAEQEGREAAGLQEDKPLRKVQAACTLCTSCPWPLLRSHEMLWGHR